MSDELGNDMLFRDDVLSKLVTVQSRIRATRDSQWQGSELWRLNDAAVNALETAQNEIRSLRARPQEPRQTIAKKFHAVIALAEECFAEFECKNPQNGAPGYPHCAACCGGTGIEAVCQEEFDFATALHDLAAAGWRYFNATGPDGQTPLNENLSAPSGAIAIAFPSPKPSVGELPETEILLAETPDVEVERYMRESFEGVGELEWTEMAVRFSDTDSRAFESPPWRIWPTKDGGVNLHYVGHLSKRCPTLPEAKSLANSLQRILSGAAE